MPKANNHLFVRFQTGNALANAQTYKCYPANGGYSILACSHNWLSSPRPCAMAACLPCMPGFRPNCLRSKQSLVCAFPCGKRSSRNDGRGRPRAGAWIEIPQGDQRVAPTCCRAGQACSAVQRFITYATFDPYFHCHFFTRRRGRSPWAGS